MSSLFDDDVERAIQSSHAAHLGQVRKGETGAPYHTHPYHVALVLARFGASSQVIIGALLHDAVEDCDDWTIERVEAEYGAAVAELVDELTENKGLDWEARKAAWVEAAKTMSPEAVQVKCADKLHNLHSLAADLESTEDADRLWGKFHGGRERTLAHARLLVEALCKRAPDVLAAELLRALERFERSAR